MPIKKTILLILLFTLSGQASDASHLEQKLTELDELIATETAQLQADQQQWQQKLQSQKDQRHQLAQEVLEQQIQKTKLENQSENTRQELDRVSASVLMFKELQVPVDDRLNRLTEQLTLDLSEIPTPLDSTQNMFENLTEFHWRAGKITFEETELYTADGQLEKVQLLSLGQNIFAYRKPNHQIAIALNSPTDATGFRWTEQLTRSQKKSLNAVFNQVATQTSGWLSVPTDISGQLTVDTNTHSSLRSGGPVMIPLAIVTLLAIILIIERTFYLSRQSQNSEKLLQNVLSACRNKNIEQAQAHCQNSNGVVARILSACLKRHSQGQQAMEDSIQEQLLHEQPRCQRYLGFIMALGGVAPLLGLLGTVTGIIKTFDAIQSVGQPQPALMATGISEALMTTAAGLIIAIPTLLLHRLLSGQADRLISDGEKSAATLLNTLLEDKPC